MHVGAKIAQAHAAIARRTPRDEFRHDVVEQRIVVVQALEGDKRADERPRLAGFDARRQQEQQRIEIVLFRHDAIFAQILRDDRRRNAVRLICAGLAIEARRQQSELGGIGDREALLDMGEAMPGGAGRQFPEVRMARQLIGRDALPGTSCAAPSRAASGIETRSGTKGSKNQRRAGSFSFSSNSRRIARSFLRNSIPSRIVSSHKTSPERPFIICAPTSSEANSG